MESMLRRKRTIIAFVMPALLIYMIISFAPVVETIYTSFFRWNMLSSDKNFIGLKNFTDLFRDRPFLISIKNTFIILVFSVITQMPAAVVLASIISTGIKGKKLFKTFYFVPNILSGAAVGLMWYFMYNSEFGLVNTVLTKIGLAGITRPWLADEHTVLWAIILVACWQFVGYHMILYLSAIEGMPESVRESAVIDGAGRWKTLWYITIPMIKPIIYVDAILISTNSLKIFDLVYTLTSGQGGPNHASSVIALRMFVTAFRDYKFGYGSAMACVLLVSCLIVMTLANSIFKDQTND